jgi:hypothetical protein
MYTDPAMVSRTTTILTTYMLVAGLLTTSTYAAFYTQFPTEGDTKGDTKASHDTIDIFRALNAISFLLSLCSILSSAGALLLLNAITPGARSQRFRPLAVKCIWVGMSTSAVLAMSILLSVASINLGASVFFTTDRYNAQVTAYALVVVGGVFVMMCMYAAFSYRGCVVEDEKVTVDRDVLAIVAMRTLLLLEGTAATNLQPTKFTDRPLADVLTFDHLVSLMTACRQDFRELKPDSVMPSAFFTPWSLARLLEDQDIAYTHSGCTVQHTIDSCMSLLESAKCIIRKPVPKSWLPHLEPERGQSKENWPMRIGKRGGARGGGGGWDVRKG